MSFDYKQTINGSHNVQVSKNITIVYYVTNADSRMNAEEEHMNAEQETLTPNPRTVVRPKLNENNSSSVSSSLRRKFESFHPMHRVPEPHSMLQEDACEIVPRSIPKGAPNIHQSSSIDVDYLERQKDEMTEPGGEHTQNSKITELSDDQLERQMDATCNEHPHQCHKCHKCNKVFKRKGNLETHMRSHEQTKPYTCTECNKRFCRKVELKLHMRVHTGEKPYHCMACNQRFARNANLKKHLRSKKHKKAIANNK
eukprot:604520_1